MTSILDDTKKVLGLEKPYEAFDADVILHINAAFSTLEQLGVGPVGGFTISDSFQEWDSYNTDQRILSHVKAYIYAKVRVMFDPPSNSSVLQALKDSISELEWRILHTIEVG